MASNPISPNHARLARQKDIKTAVGAYRASRNPRTLHGLKTALAQAGVPYRKRDRVLRAVVRIGGPNYGEDGYV